MSTKCVTLGVVVAAISCGWFAVEPASAQTYPTRLIKMILPYPPGGPTDVTARMIAEQLSSALGQPVIVENRPGGAGGTVGAKVVATAEADGYTLLYSAPGPLVTAPAIYKNVGYDPAKDFAPIATIFSSPQMLAVHPAVPVTSMRELIAHAKANPGKISYASPGFGTQPHLLGEMFSRVAGINIVTCYRGAAPAVTDLLAGQVQMYFENIATLLPHVEAAKLRALAMADARRHPQLPDVPTTIEIGFPSLQVTYWAGMLAPAGTPAAIVDKLNAAINNILSQTRSWPASPSSTRLQR